MSHPEEDDTKQEKNGDLEDQCTRSSPEASADVPSFLLANESLESSPEPELLEWPGMTHQALAPGACVLLPTGTLCPIDLLAPQQFYDWAAVNGYKVSEGVVRSITVIRQPEQKPTATILLRHQCAGANLEMNLRIPVEQPLYSKRKGWVAVFPDLVQYQFKCQDLEIEDSIYM